MGSHYLLISTLLAIVAILTCVCEPNRWSIDEVCRGKVKKFEYLSEIKGLSTEPWRFGNKKCEQTKKAIANIQTILEYNSKFKLCSPDTGKLYVELSNDYFDKHSLPEPVESFAKAIGYEISAKCKARLFTKLDDIKIINSKNKLNLIEQLEANGAVLLDKSVVGLKNTDLIRLASELMSMVNGETFKVLPVTPHIGSRTKSFLRAFRHECHRIHYTLYRDSMETLLSLIELGIDYPLDEPLTADIKEKFNDSEQLKRLINIMITCEAIQDIIVPNLPEAYVRDAAYELPSYAMPDDVLVDTDSLKDLKAKSKTIAEESLYWRATIYHRVVGQNLLFNNKALKGDRRFLTKFIEYIDSKMERAL